MESLGEDSQEKVVYLYFENSNLGTRVKNKSLNVEITFLLFFLPFSHLFIFSCKLSFLFTLHVHREKRENRVSMEGEYKRMVEK